MSIPQPPSGLEPATRGYLSALVRSLTQTFNRTPVRNVAEQQVLLVSPNGSVYTVTVSDTGVLTTTLLYDGP